MEASLNGLQGRIFLGATPLTIGQAAENQLVVDDPKVSPQHAEVRPAGQEYSIVDLGSTVGTFINQQRLPPHLPVLLQSGDSIRIANTTFTYEISSESQIAPTTFTTGIQKSDPGYQPTIAVAPSAYSYHDSDAQRPYDSQSKVSVGASSHPVPTQQQNRRRLWITFGIIAAVLLVGGIIIANLPSPSKTLDNYCGALQNGDGQTAYNQLSPGLQSKTAEGLLAFALSFNKVTSCTHDTPSVSGNSANANLTIVYANGQTVNEEVFLVQDSSGTWKIDNTQNPPSQ